MVTIDTTLAIIITAISFFCVPTILMLLIKSKRTLLVITCVLTVIFFISLCICVFSTVSIDNDFVTILFESNGKWCAKNINYTFSNLTKQDILINIFMLFPLGAFCIVFTSHRNLKLPLIWAFVIGLIVGFIIETFQFILPINRSVQLSDMIFNALSVLIGALWFWLIQFIRKKIYKN